MFCLACYRLSSNLAVSTILLIFQRNQYILLSPENQMDCSADNVAKVLLNDIGRENWEHNPLYVIIIVVCERECSYNKAVSRMPILKRCIDHIYFLLHTYIFVIHNFCYFVRFNVDFFSVILTVGKYRYLSEFIAQ